MKSAFSIKLQHLSAPRLPLFATRPRRNTCWHVAHHSEEDGHACAGSSARPRAHFCRGTRTWPSCLFVRVTGGRSPQDGRNAVVEDFRLMCVSARRWSPRRAGPAVVSSPGRWKPSRRRSSARRNPATNNTWTATDWSCRKNRTKTERETAQERSVFCPSRAVRRGVRVCDDRVFSVSSACVLRQIYGPRCSRYRCWSSSSATRMPGG